MITQWFEAQFGPALGDGVLICLFFAFVLFLALAIAKTFERFIV